MTRKPDTHNFAETSRRLRRGKDARLQHRTSVDWRYDQDRVCDKVGHTEEPVSLAWLTETLVKSATGKALVESLGLKIVYDIQHPGAQFYPATGVITLNPRRTRGDLLGMLARELRRAWQHRTGALVNPLGFEPDEAILINRAQAADVFMIAVRIAWELKLAGEQEAWNHLAGSPMSDIGRTFELKAQADFRTLNNGEAARAAYDKFFEDGRVKAHDKRLIHQMLLDENGYMRRTRGPARPLTAGMDLFHRLGEMPTGSNYLALKSAILPNDPRYAAVEDRSNANFLWFIKFERSFQQKEMQMMKDAVKRTAEIVDFAKWSLHHHEDQRRIPPSAQ